MENTKKISMFWRCQEVKSSGFSEGLDVGADGEDTVVSRVSLRFWVTKLEEEPCY